VSKINKKVLIFGIPHSGTTILKSIIGHIEEVNNILGEHKHIDDIKLPPAKKFNLIKFPQVLPSFFTQEYGEYIKIFIIRNPLWVVSSRLRRNPTRNPSYFIKQYLDAAKYFVHYSCKPLLNLHLIRYEDMFDNNFKELKTIFGAIGFKFTDDIFNNELYKNQTGKSSSTPSRPKEEDHNLFRAWQINQPFKNLNHISKIAIAPHIMDELTNNKIVQKVYPHITLVKKKYKLYNGNKV
tara:strand:+ start:236 stop:949 length:714 start_codon:yes stop_codon:yes gene_type:complete